MACDVPTWSRLSLAPPALRLTRIFCTTALIGCLAVQPTFSQTARGALLEEGTGAPIEGAFIRLLDEGDQQLHRVVGALSGPDGRFLVRAPEPGRYRLRAERIGFKSTLSDVIELAAGQTVEQVIIAPVEPVVLEGLEVTAEPVCDVRPGVGPRTAELWEEAGKALSVVAWAETRGYFRYRVVEHERELDPRSLRVREEQTWTRTVPARRGFYVSRPAEDLAEGGYVRATRADSLVYYAPDASVVLSESFADLHCFGVREGRGDEEGLIGLTFEPVPRRELADIEGVLWVDRETAELRYLEYRYTRVPLPISSTEIGGRVEFERLASGVWIVSRWWIRMPVVHHYKPLYPRPDRFRLVAIEEEGGTVLEVQPVRGTPVRLRSRTRLTGTVFDSTRAEPLVAARVFVVGGNLTAWTDVQGQFELDGLLGGEYAVSFSHPSLDSLVFTPDPVPVTLRRGRTTAVHLAVPSPGTILASLCPEIGRTEGTGAVVGVVRDVRTGSPVAGATVSLSSAQIVGVSGSPWDLQPTSERLVETEHGRGVEVTTDAAGRYRVCGVPADTTFSLQAAHEGWVSIESTLKLASDEVVRVDLDLSQPRSGADPAAPPAGRLNRPP
ncbi:MAG: carboxypeptidase regulatory-like domain-containing protein [Gemmatimonadota bacterium]|nr:MAG: carboxypeptidase regulatory-like domain-containing protein [Gemmatimonadota bacterium]